MRTLRFALALLIAAPATLRAQEKVTLGVMPLSAFALGSDAGSQAAMASALRDMLISEFSRNDKVRTIDRNAVDELLRQRNLSLSGQLGDKDANEIAQLVGAQYMIQGGMTVAGADARMDLRLVDPETGKISNTFKEKGNKDDLIGVVERVAAKFRDNLQIKQRVAEVVVPIPSLFAYTRGLDYEKRGERRKAAEMYEAALKIFPENAAAKLALGRVK